MAKAVKSISLFFPMYNEKAYIEKMVNKARQVLSDMSDDYEILIVDDCSSDGSEKTADRLADEDSHIRVIHHHKNMGYGAALRTGFTNASKDYVFYTDCDEPVDLEVLKSEVLKMSDRDVLAGYRIKRHDSFRRFVYTKVYNFLVRNLFNVRVRDVNFSFKIIKRSVLQASQLTSGSVFIDGELLAEAVRHGFIVKDSPIDYSPRTEGSSSFNSIKAATDTLKEIGAYYIKVRREAIRSLWHRLLERLTPAASQDEQRLEKRTAGKKRN